MIASATTIPARRADLIIKPIGEAGRYVVKDPRTAEFFQIGEEEHFLLLQLDGERDAGEICAAFEERFGEPLSADDLDGFVAMATKQGLLQSQEPVTGSANPESNANAPRSALLLPRSKQSILYWRKSFFDPDRLFTRLQPKLWFCWTPAFLIGSAACIIVAACVAWVNAAELVSYFPHVLRWETLLAVWLTLAVVTTCHEFAHGLTCKRYGSEVHEIGFLLIFLMPAFYCNVSDAWLFQERSKRLWVTFAGGFFELFLWALALFAWRLSVQDSLLNYLAWVVLSVTGIRVFFNFNPLIKLDGYYLLSDLLEIPNLRQRALGYAMGHLRWALWGANRPQRQERGRFLLGFGVASWLFSIMILGLILFAFGRYLGEIVGPLGFGVVALLGVVVMRGLFQGLSNGEVLTMIRRRFLRTACWLLILGGLLWLLGFVEIADRVGGPLTIRSTQRTELRAPVAGFLQQVHYEQGEHVSPGAPVVRMAIPDLDSRIAQKQAELREAEAALRLLQAGTDPAELKAQQSRVRHAEEWRDFAQQDLARSKKVLQADLKRLEQQIVQHKAELDAARDKLIRAARLLKQKVYTDEEYRDAQREVAVREAVWKQSQEQLRMRTAAGTQEAEEELARREKELADAGAQLALLEAESRPEEIAAAEARVARMNEELRFLKDQQQKLAVFCPFPGVVTTPHMKEKRGEYLQEGDLICRIEEPADLKVEIALDEDDLERIQLGQTVTLKTRALPYDSFSAVVERITPAAERDEGEVQSTVTVTCRLNDPPATLRPGMTGYARITTGRDTIGRIALDRALRFLRTEFWW